MFAPKAAKLQAKVAETRRLVSNNSTVVGHRLCRNPAEQALGLQRTIGNQATLRRATNLTGSKSRADHEQEAEPANMTARWPTPSVSWDFSKIPIFPPDRANRPQVRTSLSAPPALESVIQAKLAVGEVNDPLEHEADRTADRVMRAPEPQLEPTCACGGGCPKCQTEKLARGPARLQTNYVGPGDLGSTVAPPIVPEVLRSPGQPLDAATRAFMEPRFGHDFSRVRVHSDTPADRSARAVNAHAYTSGHNIVFAAGQYLPGTREGNRLLAHELTHVLQQGFGRQQGVLQRDDKPPVPAGKPGSSRISMRQ